jgi:arsenite oxidase small subunit
MDETEKKEDNAPEASSDGRRSFLKIALAASVLAVIGGIGSVGRAISAPAEALPSGTTSTQTATTASSTGTTSITGIDGFPVSFVTTLSSLLANQPVYFNYPLDDEPSVLVKLGAAVEDGVGPDSDVIAFSQVCQHLGCIYAFLAPGASPQCNSSYKAAGPLGYCCCHGSIYDFTMDAKVIGGPAPRPVPRVVLDVDSAGNIYAVGMSGANIYGHANGDLQD